MDAKRRVLMVGDDETLRRLLERCLAREGCEVLEIADGDAAIARLGDGLSIDLILTDLDGPGIDGRTVLAAGLKRQIPVVLITGHASVEEAVALMRQGAANFLSKPVSTAALRGLLEDAFGQKLERTSPGVARPVIIGEDPPFRRILDTLQAVADTDATVLVMGESGTGKEVAARTIHAASRRAKEPFIAVNCGAIPEPLLESELFGHSKGAFTGATHSRAGRFQMADGGTIFLDEIGDMPLSFQVKLLRVLQERRFEVLGEGISRYVDVRVIAATHRDLSGMVMDGEFREDLYYRLNVVDIRLPPLRERRGDIPLLVEQFLRTANDRYQRAVTGVTPAVLAAFESYSWPGNIRELANVVERMVVLRRSGVIDIGDLPAQFRATPVPRTALTATLPPGGLDLRQALADYEDSLIAQALSRTGGNRNAAATLLGLNRTTLVEKLRRRR